MPNDFVHLFIHERQESIYLPFHRLHEVTGDVSGSEMAGLVFIDPLEPKGKRAFIASEEQGANLSVHSLKDSISRGERIEVSEIDFD